MSTAINTLTLLEAELNMINPPAARVAQLTQLLSVASSRLAQTGITLDLSAEGDAHLQVEYAAWLYRRRQQSANAQMPEYLRLDINDRLIHGKAGADDE